MISSYYYKGPAGDPWEFEETSFSSLNVLVGASGSGKTRFLNTIFNFSGFVSSGQPFRSGTWKITIRTDDYLYIWEINGETTVRGKNEIGYELLTRTPGSANQDPEVVIHRTADTFKFLGQNLPKLQRDKLSVTLLKEEEAIKPVYETFLRVQRRNFHDEGLRDALAFQPIDSQQVKDIQADGILALWRQENALSAKMYLLKEYFPEFYRVSIDSFKTVFPSIIECDVHMSKELQLRVPAMVPVFAVKEKGVNKWIGLHELSSGMQKVLLIISDIVSLPKGSIYIVDEYENSLGINAIDFLPQFLVDHGEGIQFIITTHHPFLINNVPMKSWRVFHRLGSKVTVREGIEFEQKYGKSKQQAFTQLINDPFYAGNE